MNINNLNYTGIATATTAAATAATAAAATTEMFNVPFVYNYDWDLPDIYADIDLDRAFVYLMLFASVYYICFISGGNNPESMDEEQDQLEADYPMPPLRNASTRARARSKDKNKKYINKFQLICNTQLHKSVVQTCTVNGTQFTAIKYDNLLRVIYSMIDHDIIINWSVLNVTTEVFNSHGYKYYKNLGLSIKSASEARILNEISNMCTMLSYNLELFIILEDGSCVHYKQ